MQKIIIASGPVIIENNKVLLDIQGDDNFWKFCGGRVREDESLSQTAIRRAKEELGIDIEILNPVPYILYSTKEQNGENFDVILVHFLSSHKGQIKPGEMVSEWQWHELDNMPENLGPNILPTLRYFGYIK